MTAQIRPCPGARRAARPSPIRGWATRLPAAGRAQRLRGRARRRAARTASIDWDATLRFREHLWAHGFGLAEAMDTAQRGMGLAWTRPAS